MKSKKLYLSIVLSGLIGTQPLMQAMEGGMPSSGSSKLSFVGLGVAAATPIILGQAWAGFLSGKSEKNLLWNALKTALIIALGFTGAALESKGYPAAGAGAALTAASMAGAHEYLNTRRSNTIERKRTERTTDNPDEGEREKTTREKVTINPAPPRSYLGFIGLTVITVLGAALTYSQVSSAVGSGVSALSDLMSKK